MENYDVLVKIPCILACCVAAHISWSPPAQSGKTEALPAQDWAEQFLNLAVPHVWMIRTFWWVIGMAEVVAILLHIFNPSSSYLPVGAFTLGLRKSTLVGALLIVLGAGLRCVCYQTLANQFTFELSIRAKHTLVTKGPYSIVRHPSYSGYIMVYVGLALWHGSKGSWMRESGVLETLVGKAVIGAFTSLLLAIGYCLMIRAPKEDEKLKEIFGGEWEDYAKRVPYILIPGIL